MFNPNDFKTLLGDTSQTIIPCLLFIIYLHFICLHTYLLLFGSYLILSSCQQTLSLSHYYWNPPAVTSLLLFLSLLRLLTLLQSLYLLLFAGCPDKSCHK